MNTTTPRPEVMARLSDVTKIYGTNETKVTALDHLTLDIHKTQFTAITGPSGCGKSTLLHVLAGLDTPTHGHININGTEITTLKDATKFRRDTIGFIFQAFNLIPTMTAQDNITLPLRLAGRKPDTEWMLNITNMLGITNRLNHTPGQLSGGQIQRVAIARALVTKPAIILADEPTGNLDSQASNDVLNILQTAVHQIGQTLLMVTHDRHAASKADRVITLKDGRINHDLTNPTPQQLQQVM